MPEGRSVLLLVSRFFFFLIAVRPKGARRAERSGAALINPDSFSACHPKWKKPSRVCGSSLTLVSRRIFFFSALGMEPRHSSNLDPNTAWYSFPVADWFGCRFLQSGGMEHKTALNGFYSQLVITTAGHPSQIVDFRVFRNIPKFRISLLRWWF